MSRRNTGFPDAVRQVIVARSAGRCEKCGEAWAEAHHHRRPRGAGGSRRADTNTPVNALALDNRCHEWIESHRTEALENGWLVRQSASPADVPVLYRGRMAWLRDDGGVEYLEEVA
ncbi:hypothetical protein NIIDNTM18_42690 [Mycolicibacterium litorale]|uniref:HNH endonuclease n=1 Tax=Mycolicibacterium litorale TaxID=758802 RepID=A0A6S6PB91_9MYCO|nr:hypothetical protein NIIDNTM18_42690 [Mycolicibacterium litorale]